MKSLVFALVVFLFIGFDQSDANGFFYQFPLGTSSRLDSIDGTQVTGLGGTGRQPCGCHTSPMQVPSSPCGCSKNLGYGQTCEHCGAVKSRAGTDYAFSGILGRLLSGFQFTPRNEYENQNTLIKPAFTKFDQPKIFIVKLV